jgi:hypothetical protein
MNCTKSCFNCKNACVYGGSLDTRDCPGEAPMAECRLAMDAKGRTLDKTLFELGEQNEWREEIMPTKCGHYDPILIEKCGYCGKVMNSPEFSHEFYGFDAYSGERVAVCSKECGSKLGDSTKEAKERFDKEYDDYAREQASRCNVSVRLSCNGDLVKEDKVESVDIREDFQGRDVLTFKCPECGKTHESLRFG